MTTIFNIGENEYKLELPGDVDVLNMKGASPIDNPTEAIQEALDNPIGTDGFDSVIREKLNQSPNADAVIVISDNTRPVPYKGEQGILLPIVDRLLSAGITSEKITILCANGTHTPLSDEIFHEMIDPVIYEKGIEIVNHDCLDEDELIFLGFTSKGTEIKINRKYVDADIKILTGLVESHFMAGISGGRKSICPGLIGEDSTFIFHSAEFLDDEHAEDLNLVSNPCHEEALEVANTVGADFILNVTLNQDFDVTGFFAGDLVEAHLAAYKMVQESVAIRTSETYDIVVTHAGFVGKNHYQAAKAAIAAIPLLREDSYLIMAADCVDVDPVGKDTYRQVLPYLKSNTFEDFVDIIKSENWVFVPDQWQVQMWAKLFKVISKEQFVFYAPQIAEEDYDLLTGLDGNRYLPLKRQYLAGSSEDIIYFIQSALMHIIDDLKSNGRKAVKIAWLSDGPYGIVVK